jgi:hypothetical protein
MDEAAQDLKLLMGKRIKIEKNGETREGILIDEVDHVPDGQDQPIKMWALANVLAPNDAETYFAANDGWTVTHLPDDPPPDEMKKAGQK